jgi:hypothetical protein
MLSCSLQLSNDLLTLELSHEGSGSDLGSAELLPEEEAQGGAVGGDPLPLPVRQLTGSAKAQQVGRGRARFKAAWRAFHSMHLAFLRPWCWFMPGLAAFLLRLAGAVAPCLHGFVGVFGMLYRSRMRRVCPHRPRMSWIGWSSWSTGSSLTSRGACTSCCRPCSR